MAASVTLEVTAGTLYLSSCSPVLQLFFGLSQIFCSGQMYMGTDHAAVLQVTTDESGQG